MPDTLTDVFAPDAFSVYNLTAAIQKIPPANLRISSTGIFREIPIPGTLVEVEESNGLLSIVPTTARGGAGIPGRDPKRKVTTFKVPHIQVDDTVMADDVLNVRAFGSNDPSPVGEVVGRKFALARQSVDFTNEFLRIGALRGKVIYPDNSVDADLDLYTAFGATNQATDQQTVDFVWGTDTTELLSTVIPTLFDKMEVALGGTPFGGIHVFCGRTFFRNLVKQGTVKAAYLAQQKQWDLAQVARGSVGGAASRMTFSLGGVTFEEYYNVAGPAQGVGNDGLFQAAEGIAIPLGVDIFHTYYAPADLPETVGTLGQSMYARQYMSTDGKRTHLETQSNPLNICVRPKALIKCYSTT